MADDDDKDDDQQSTVEVTMQQMLAAVNQGVALPRKWQAEELDDRRALALKLRLRGMSYYEIGEKMGYSHVTAKNDCVIAKESAVEVTKQYDPQEDISNVMVGFDDMYQEAWKVASSARDPEIKLKALAEARRALNDKQKAMQTAGLIKDTVPITNQINITSLGHWSEQNVAEAIHAILGMSLKTKLLEPQPDLDALNEIHHIDVTPVDQIADEPEIEVINNLVLTEEDLEESEDDQYE